LSKNTQNPFSRNGGFGTHITIPADLTFPIPKNLPLDVIAPLFYSGAVAYNIINK
jgi:D-arabinose 1-dehydrogenase-like Zn-dependent alcohol dehydrogenase